MARRKKQSISTMLVSALGFLFMCKVFLWVVEYQFLHVPVVLPELNYAIIGVLVALLLRIGFVVWIGRRKKAAIESTANALSSVSVPNVNDLNMCVTCGKTVSEKVKQFCLGKPDRFQGQIYCFDHQSDHR